MTKVGIIGNGGREHAMGWSISQHPDVEEVLYFRGNPGTAKDDKCTNYDLDGTKKENFGALAHVVEKESIDMLVVGPEQPLVDGIVDFFAERGHHNMFGPTGSAARIESDKFFSYNMMNAAGIPQAKSAFCMTTEEAEKAIREMATDKGIVIKARGLTAGKGVYVCDTIDEALARLKEHAKEFGPEVLIAERLYGEEFSVFGISDGKRVVPLEISVQDHKRLFDKDKGPNTGGMGAYGPAPVADAKMVRLVAEKMMAPVVQQMKKQGTEYKGFLYAAVIMTENGPKILEYNCRLGDPETQPLVMMLKDGLYQPIKSALEGKLDQIKVEFKPGAACCVVMASNGYPNSKVAGHVKGLPIGGLEEAAKSYNIFGIHNVKVFHAGTGLDDEGRFIVAGGRVLGVTAYSKTKIGIADAQTFAYLATNAIDKATRELNNRVVLIYRKDIAGRALKTFMGR